MVVPVTVVARPTTGALVISKETVSLKHIRSGSALRRLQLYWDTNELPSLIGWVRPNHTDSGTGNQ